jgi:hypothetical protein
LRLSVAIFANALERPIAVQDVCFVTSRNDHAVSDFTTCLLIGLWRFKGVRKLVSIDFDGTEPVLPGTAQRRPTLHEKERSAKMRGTFACERDQTVCRARESLSEITWKGVNDTVIRRLFSIRSSSSGSSRALTMEARSTRNADSKID